MRVTFLLFYTPDGKERFFSVYNHSEGRWRRLPFDKSFDLHTHKERNLFSILVIVGFLIVGADSYWFRESSHGLLWVPLVLLVLVFTGVIGSEEGV